MVIFKQFAPVNVVVSGVIMSLVLILVELFLLYRSALYRAYVQKKSEGGVKLLFFFNSGERRNCKSDWVCFWLKGWEENHVIIR